MAEKREYANGETRKTAAQAARPLPPFRNEIEHHGVEQRVLGGGGHRRKLRVLHRRVRRCAQGRVAS